MPLMDTMAAKLREAVFANANPLSVRMLAGGRAELNYSNWRKPVISAIWENFSKTTLKVALNAKRKLIFTAMLSRLWKR